MAATFLVGCSSEPTGVTSEAPAFSIHEAMKDVTGGTGRFAGATGRVTEVGTKDGFAAPSVSVLEGTISRVGAK